jgi:arylsulfatase A-like enzyme
MKSSSVKTKRKTKLKYFTFIVAMLLVATLGMYFTSQSIFPPAQKTRTNIVLIMTDDQNVDSLPVMRKLMAFPEGSWVNFANAFVNNSFCCPSRATVLTGQYSHVTGVIDNESGQKLNDTNTLPVWLAKAGYQTVLIGKYLNNYPWDKGEGYVPPGWTLFQVDSRGGVDRYTKRALDFINNSKSPFFLYLAYRAPHYPARPLHRYAAADVYLPPDPPNFNEADVSDKPEWLRELDPLSQSAIDNWKAERVASQRALLGIDDGVQQIIDALKAKDQLDNTLIIFMSDNGFSWGSHRYIRKQCAYEECSKIPLLIRYPGLRGNRDEYRLVSNVDLAATIAEYAGIAPALPENGKSLIPVITNTASNWNEEILLERIGTGPFAFYGIRVPGWKYIEYFKGDVELYDLNADPYELQNLANRPEYQSKQAELAHRLQLLKQGPP